MPPPRSIRWTAVLVIPVLIAVAGGADGPPRKTEPHDARPAPRTKTPPPSAVPAAVVPTAIVTGCRLDRRLFRSFTAGVVDYCRGHLDYVPGALDCYAFTEEVCSLYTPASGEWGESRRPGVPDVFPCPDDVQPPVCPRFTWR